MRTLSNLDTTTATKFTTPSTTTATTPAFCPPAIVVQKSPWHSPLPYLFGGLAAMFGLIAFALVLLACSYWRLSSRLNNQESDRGEEIGSDEKSESTAGGRGKPVFEEKIVVIMAGHVRPTFLATPMSSKACPFGDGLMRKNDDFDKEKVEIVGKVKHEVSDGDDQTERSDDEN